MDGGDVVVIHIYLGASSNSSVGRVAIAYTIYSGYSLIEHKVEILPYNEHKNANIEVSACFRALDRATFFNFSEIALHRKNKWLAELINTGTTRQSYFTQYIPIINSYKNNLKFFEADNANSRRLTEARNLAKDALNDYVDIDSEYIIYADGFCFSNRYTGGFIITEDGSNIYENCVSSNVWMDSGRIAGSILAIVEALSWCKEHNIKKVVVKYVDECIGKWIEGEWQSNNILSRKFVDFVNSLDMQINFIKDYPLQSKDLRRAGTLARHGI